MNQAGRAFPPGPRPALHPAWIALLVGIAPIVVVHACYALSIQAGTAPACIPYFEGCTSISRAARHGLSNHVFKAVMLPCAAMIALFWWLAAAWLRSNPPDDDEGDAGRGRRIGAMRALGFVGALFLVLYATFLGVEGDLYRWMRRYGVTIYFSFTVLGQMTMASLLPAGAGLRRALAWTCALMLGLGLASIPLQHVFSAGDVAVNALEWNYALLMSLGFVFVGAHWARARVHLSFR